MLKDLRIPERSTTIVILHTPTTEPGFLTLCKLPDSNVQTGKQFLFRRDFSLQEFHDFGFSLRELSYDLHASGLRAKDVTTEYEEKFSRWGETIKYAKVQYTGEAEGRTGAEARQEESQD